MTPPTPPSWRPTSSARPSTASRCLRPHHRLPALADAVEEAPAQVAATKHSGRIGRRCRDRSPGSSSSTTSIEALRVVDAYAEHLEVQTRDAAAVAARSAQCRRRQRRTLDAGAPG